VDLQTRAHNYEVFDYGYKGKCIAPLDLQNPLHIDKIVGEAAPHIPNSMLKRSIHNLNAQVAHNYSIVEDLA
jgi:hypothetical protein